MTYMRLISVRCVCFVIDGQHVAQGAGSGPAFRRACHRCHESVTQRRQFVYAELPCTRMQFSGVVVYGIAGALYSAALQLLQLNLSAMRQ